MTTTKTHDVDGTLAQIYALAGAGADIVRVTCNTVEAAQGIAEMMPRSPVPLVADIHYQYKLALAAIEAGVSALRLNPGNIRNETHIKEVATAGEVGRHPHPDRCERWIARQGPPGEVRRSGSRSPRRVGDDGGRLLRRRRLPRRQDLREALGRAAHGRELPDPRRRRPITRSISVSPRRGRPPAASSSRLPVSPRSSTRASATPSASRSRPTRSRRPRPARACSNTSGSESVPVSTSSRVRRADALRST